MVSLREFADYETNVARALFEIESRGILVDPAKLKVLKDDIDSEIIKELGEIASVISRPTVLSKEDAKGIKNAFVVQSTQQLTKELEAQGHKLPTKRGTGKSTADAAALYKLLSETGSPMIHAVLKIRELSKLQSVYVKAPLHENTLFGSFRVTGTETGRRASAESIFGLGTNLQNIPKWSDWAHRFRSCLVARPGKIFMQFDQKSAEDWVINAIIADVSGDESGIKDLRSGVNRHIKLASFIFGMPKSEISKESIQYYLAKRTRYAGAYGMWKYTMAQTLASEGKIFHPDECGMLLERFFLAEPAIKGVYQKWVEKELRSKRVLTTPLGRRRQFFSLRPFSDNGETFRKGYAFEPQSTVGDNTGMAIVEIERQRPIILSESHDSILAEVDDDEFTVHSTFDLVSKAFDRELTFPVSGYKIKIPISAEIGYDLGHMKEIAECDGVPTGLATTWQELGRSAKATQGSTSGAVQQ